ncbi:hypothetical protein ACIP5Y_27840 [Nocardia sp. NPDC088792]|uniref:hypothetical protein n=1 Tax=Nocardia sp. NPDC088792 TaxID=3364332 RepID=UPI00382D3189
MTTALHTHGDKLTCFTAALASALAARGETQWWRPLLADGPFLAVTPAAALLRFEHHATPPLPALGLRITGDNDWDTAYSAISAQIAEHGVAVILADTYRLPWQRGHRRLHAPHWLAIVDEGGWVAEDPLSMTTEYGPQPGTRVHIPDPDKLRTWAVSLGATDRALTLREEAMAGTTDIAAHRTYRWLEADPARAQRTPQRADPDRQQSRLGSHHDPLRAQLDQQRLPLDPLRSPPRLDPPLPQPSPRPFGLGSEGLKPTGHMSADRDRLSGPDALRALAARYRFARTEADFDQIDDLWQALRQRELLLWAAEHDPGLLDEAGRAHWEQAVARWRTLPPLLLHARMRAASGKTADTGRLAETLSELAELEPGPRVPATSSPTGDHS